MVDNMERSGGVALFWKDDLDVLVLNFYRHHIEATISSLSGTRWCFTSIYRYSKFKHSTWELLMRLNTHLHIPWLLGGNFNEVLAWNEKYGRDSRNNGEMFYFCKVLLDYDLDDLGFSGAKLIWDKFLSFETSKFSIWIFGVVTT
ncbi:Endonuclease/exonuclease/phosphatase [Trema orientale]|uniref:Endonuclease/exonuclease/phosphatase n=1 Tax=Trema orientale TaxID=63057 RepID=A0A2P5AWZ8_TREOI|nr:Endonuclease/exonuclease/phosphatase [Trema orientale]